MTRLAKALGIFLALAFILGEVLVLCQSTQPQPSAAAHQPPLDPSTSAFPLAVTGEDGRSLILRVPHRIVSFSPGHTEVLYAIGAGGLLVGAAEFSDYPLEAKDARHPTPAQRAVQG